MIENLILVGFVIVLCILINRFASKLGIPSLLVFMALGMCFGVNGLFKIQFDDYPMSEIICSVCLIFIMFYGGFGTNFKAARPVVIRSALLATVGVVMTAALVGCFVHLFLNLPWLQSLLIGSVIASTDAASVFNILRFKNLNLKYNTASLLELESGSNDPVSYMLTIVLITTMTGGSLSLPALLFRQLFFGISFGLMIGKLSVEVLKRFNFSVEQGETIYVFAIAMLAYAIPSALGGNGYLSVYLAGISMRNSVFPKKRNLVHFFDVITGVAQMMIFFLLGLLVTPSQLPEVFFPALAIMLFMTFIARPITITALLLPFGSPWGQIGLVSWSGLRGVASIVFAILVVLAEVPLHYNLFNLVFCIVLFSISLQGSLLPQIAKKMNMLDRSADVRRTFNDYQEDSDVCFIKIHIDPQHPWINLKLCELTIPSEFLIAMILRQEGNLVPNGNTIIHQGDLLVIAAQEFIDNENLTMQEITLDKNHKWTHHTLKEISVSQGTLIVMIRRGQQTIIPSGDTFLMDQDTLVIASFK